MTIAPEKNTDAMPGDEARQSVITACRKAWERGLLAGFNGKDVVIRAINDER